MKVDSDDNLDTFGTESNLQKQVQCVNDKSRETSPDLPKIKKDTKCDNSKEIDNNFSISHDSDSKHSINSIETCKFGSDTKQKYNTIKDKD